MGIEYYVLSGGKVLYSYGHYDLEGAEAVMKQYRKLHPRAKITIVKIVATYEQPTIKERKTYGEKAGRK